MSLFKEERDCLLSGSDTSADWIAELLQSGRFDGQCNGPKSVTSIQLLRLKQDKSSNR
jgi:hypothetical protein